MYADVSFQNVGKIKARAYLDLESTPFFLKVESTSNDDSGDHYSWGEICLHLADRALAADLVEAINRVVSEHESKIEQSSAA